jgi:hypothetical protein
VSRLLARCDSYAFEYRRASSVEALAAQNVSLVGLAANI